MRFILILMLVVVSMYSQELDELLSAYTYNSDLSEKTKSENGGTVIVFTRQDLERMQARSLKDLLKSHPILRYKESRYGTPDMEYFGGFAMFSGSNERVFIDNQEITSATFGSGFLFTRFIDFSVIDHVEIYSRAPSFEFSTEPTYLLIKLYTKVAERDRGGSIKLSYGNRDFNQESLFYADELENISYVASITRLDDRKKTYLSHEIPIKRDSESYGFFGSLYSEHNKLQLVAAKANPNLSMAQSPQGTYAVSEGSFDFIHLGYESSYFEDTFLSIAYQQTQMEGKFEESPGYETFSPDKHFKRSEHVVTAIAKHNIETADNRLIAGAKVRYKNFVLDEAKLNGTVLPSPEYDMQTLYSGFVEDRYSFSDRNIISLSAQYTRVQNNADKKDEDLYQARLSHTYSYEDLIFNSAAYHTESLVEPYIYVSFPTVGSLDVQRLDALSEEIKYNAQKHDLTLLLTYIVIQDLLQPSSSGGYINNSDDVSSLSGYVEYTYNHDLDNKITANLSYSYIKEEKIKERAAFIRMLNTQGAFDIFNELVYNHSNLNNRHYYDYSAGVRYHYNDRFTLAIKGENIFAKAYEDTYIRIDPATSTTETPVLISPIEQRVYFTMEYFF